MIEPWGKLPGHFKKKRRRKKTVLFLLASWRSFSTLYTELCGQLLCLRDFSFLLRCDVATARKFSHDLMSDELFHFRSLRGPPCFLLFFLVGFASTFLTSLNLRPMVYEASLASSVACVQRGPSLKKTTYEEEFDKPHKYRLPKCLMTM